VLLWPNAQRVITIKVIIEGERMGRGDEEVKEVKEVKEVRRGGSAGPRD
jgi:hypothetical protein